MPGARHEHEHHDLNDVHACVSAREGGVKRKETSGVHVLDPISVAGMVSPGPAWYASPTAVIIGELRYTSSCTTKVDRPTPYSMGLLASSWDSPSAPSLGSS
jgi:hypothetical protein